jgi:hypothetical protein
MIIEVVFNISDSRRKNYLFILMRVFYFFVGQIHTNCKQDKILSNKIKIIKNLLLLCWQIHTSCIQDKTLTNKIMPTSCRAEQQSISGESSVFVKISVQFFSVMALHLPTSTQHCNVSTIYSFRKIAKKIQ